MNFLDNVTDDAEYEHINITVLDLNITGMSLVIFEVKFFDIGYDDTLFHG